MKLLRKINNNAAVAQDNRGREMVVLGRGVGFHPMPYELTDLSVVYRTFYDVDPQYYEILSNLPEDALLAAADITEQAEITLHTELNPNLPFTLAKGLLDAVLCMVIYKPLSPILHGRK